MENGVCSNSLKIQTLARVERKIKLGIFVILLGVMHFSIWPQTVFR